MALSTPTTLLAALSARGIRVEAVAGRLKVTPAQLLTPADRAAIQAHRHALLVFLVNPPIESGLCPWCGERPSLCPPYGLCQPCTEDAWMHVAPPGTRST